MPRLCFVFAGAARDDGDWCALRTRAERSGRAKRTGAELAERTERLCEALLVLVEARVIAKFGRRAGKA